MAEVIEKEEIYIQYVPGDKHRDKLVNDLTELPPYQKPVWYSAHLVSVTHLVHPDPDVQLRREIIFGSDGGVFAVDWGREQGKPNDSIPILVVVPGIGGGEGCRHITNLCTVAASMGWRSCILRHRGWGEPVTTFNLFDGIDGSDLVTLLTTLRETFPTSPICGIGMSAGSAIITRYISETGSKSLLCAGISICNAFDLKKALVVLENSGAMGQIYSLGVAKVMARTIDRNKKLISERGFDCDKAMSTRSLSDYIEATAVPLYGYKSVDNYYESAECHSKLHQVTKPILFLQMRDDPLFSGRVKDIIPLEQLAKNPNLVYMEVPYGGHLGWVEGKWTRNQEGYIDRILKVFISYVEQKYELNVTRPALTLTTTTTTATETSDIWLGVTAKVSRMMGSGFMSCGPETPLTPRPQCISDSSLSSSDSLDGANVNKPSIWSRLYTRLMPSL